MDDERIDGQPPVCSWLRLGRYGEPDLHQTLAVLMVDGQADQRQLVWLIAPKLNSGDKCWAYEPRKGLNGEVRKTCLKYRQEPLSDRGSRTERCEGQLRNGRTLALEAVPDPSPPGRGVTTPWAFAENSN